MPDYFELPPNVNTGVDMRPISPTDYFASGESAALKTVLELSGDYSLWLPDEESQFRFLIDISGCVSFSALNNLETTFNWLLAHNRLSTRAYNFLKNEGYIDPATGKVNFSDRYTAKMSGTTKLGNSLPAVGDSIRKLHGLVPEKDWPWPPSMTESMSADEKWDLYYTTVPAYVIEKGKRFLDFFTIQYEWVVIAGSTPNAAQAIKLNLQYGPMQIAAAVCSPWGSNEGMPPIAACTCNTQHATLIYGDRVTGNPWKDFDHYKSFRKLLAPDYCVPYALQYHVNEKIEVVPPAGFHYIFNVNLTYGSSGSLEVNKLQEALQYLGYMKAGLFGPYGPQTKVAVKKFQMDNGIINDDGSNFGPRSRAAMNKKLNP